MDVLHEMFVQYMKNSSKINLFKSRAELAVENLLKHGDIQGALFYRVLVIQSMWSENCHRQPREKHVKMKVTFKFRWHHQKIMFICTICTTKGNVAMKTATVNFCQTSLVRFQQFQSLLEPFKEKVCLGLEEEGVKRYEKKKGEGVLLIVGLFTLDKKLYFHLIKH